MRKEFSGMEKANESKLVAPVAIDRFPHAGNKRLGVFNYPTRRSPCSFHSDLHHLAVSLGEFFAVKIAWKLGNIHSSAHSLHTSKSLVDERAAVSGPPGVHLNDNLFLTLTQQRSPGGSGRLVLPAMRILWHHEGSLSPVESHWPTFLINSWSF
jgi:hypothetical protein